MPTLNYSDDNVHIGDRIESRDAGRGAEDRTPFARLPRLIPGTDRDEETPTIITMTAPIVAYFGGL